MFLNSIALPDGSTRSAWLLPLAFGCMSIGSVLLLLYGLWTILILGGIALFTLAMAESETVILASIFLLPLAWVVRTDAPISNVIVPARDIAILGFFLGRLWRGELNPKTVWQYGLTKLSLGFLVVSIASVTFGRVGLTHGSYELFRS